MLAADLGLGSRLQLPELRRRALVPQVAYLRNVTPRPRALVERIRVAIRDFPCDLLFVHRDAEGQPLGERVQEVRTAAYQAGSPDHVPVVPVRMTEAWLLIDPQAIRIAADNPNGSTPMSLPALHRIEEISDPKIRIQDCMSAASGKRGRRLDQFERRLLERIQRVASLIDDFSPLRQLSAFAAFETATKKAVIDLMQRRLR